MSAATASNRTTPPATSNRRTLGFFSPLGGSSRRSSSPSAGRTFAAFSSPTSISTLIVSSVLLRVNPFHLPDRARQVRARLVEAIKRRNLVVIGARQRILRLNDFNVVGH